MIHSLSLCAEVVLDLHNLNSEGTEGNQQQTRMVHIVDKDGKRHVVNAISGDMLKHIFVEHLTPLLEEAGQKLSAGAKILNPDRVITDPAFKEAIKGKKQGSAIQEEMLKLCAVTDIAGTLLTEGNSVARKSCAEFGWVVGLPNKSLSEQYFHVKFDPDTRAKSAGQDDKGEGTVAGRQAIFHRPANSGVYALVCHLELSRIGINDITRKEAITAEDRKKRQRAAIQALLATLIKPSGAQRNTQNPHIVDCRGMISTSTSHLPAPTVSPICADYCSQMERITSTLNKITKDSVKAKPFESLAAGVAILQEISSEV
jgi:CRISPR-associated protein Cst2